MLKNSLFSPLCSAPFFCFSLFFLFFFFFSAPHTSFSFLFPVSCFPRCCSAPALFFFSFCVLPFNFQPKILIFQPKCFSAQKHFFQPKTFLLQPKTFFSLAQYIFFFLSVQPLFSSSFFCFILFWFSPLFFLFERLLFFFSLAPFIQDPIFSLAASHLFYLNKSLFSSNLE